MFMSAKGHRGRSSTTRLRKRAPALAAALCLLASGLPAAAAKIVKIFIPGSSQTVAYGINDSGWITGGWGYAGGDHGFLRAPDGTITSFDPPESSVTYGLCINGKAAIGGHCIDNTGSPGHGLL